MPTLIATPARIEAAGNKPIVIDEYVGQVRSGHSEVSIALLQCPAGWIEPGQTPEFEELTLVLKGILRVAHRGGILDVYSPEADRPIRVDFFGDEIESMRKFDPASQRSARTTTP